MRSQSDVCENISHRTYTVGSSRAALQALAATTRRGQANSYFSAALAGQLDVRKLQSRATNRATKEVSLGILKEKEDRMVTGSNGVNTLSGKVFTVFIPVF